MSDAGPADDRPVGTDPDRLPLPDDPEAPTADALDQATEVAPGPRSLGTDRRWEASDADLLEQAEEVPTDDDFDLG